MAGVLTLLVASLAVTFDLHEALFRYTRHLEWLQVDELPIVLLTLSASLIWVAWRRYRQARREVFARRAAEARLSAVLAENRGLAQQHLQLLEAERRRLARELHDELGQYLNAIKLDAVALLAPQVPAALARETGQQIMQSVDHVHVAVSDMIRRLRPVGLDELGLGAAIEACVDQWRRRLPTTRFSLTLEGDLGGLGETLNLTVYRLIQEGLTNAYKHAGASHVQVSVERNAVGTAHEHLRIAVTDDGRGIALDSPHGGFGIGGMRERVELLGGAFHIASRPGEGFTVMAELPCADLPPLEAES